jgi:universal stress protein A
VRVARERDIDLIVISSHGRTGWGRMIFGSTAESVVRHAHCPVLVVKPGESDK